VGLTPLILATLLADPVELNAGIATELRGGDSPVLANQESHAFVATVTTPQGDLELKDRRVYLRLTYFPRLVWQSPNALDRTLRPLLLNQAALSLIGRPTMRTRITAHAFGSYGEPDYSILPQLVGTGQGTPPLGSGQAAVPQVQKILTLSAGVLVESDLNRRFLLACGLDGSHFRPIAESSPAKAPPGTMQTISFLIEQTTVAASPGIIYRLTPHDALALTVNTTYVTYSGGIALALVNTTLSWRALRSARDEFRVELGVAEAHDLGTASAVPDRQAVSPTGSIDALLHIFSEDEYGLWTRLRVAVEEYVDPVLTQVYPRALVYGQITLVMAPDWSAGIQGDFATSLRTAPAATNLDETALSIVLPVRHRVTPNVIVEIGGRWSERAPALTATNFGFRERQIWAYLSLTATTRARPAWSGR